MSGRARSSLLEFSIALPQILGQVALQLLQFPNLASNLGEFVFQQVADLITGIAATIPQIEKVFDLLQGEAEALHLLDEVEADDVISGVETKLTGCPRCRRQQRWRS